jgi:hypothetical protein
MLWRDYLQHNSNAKDTGIEGGNIYSWAYDDQVCAKGGNTRTLEGIRPICSNTQDENEGAISDLGEVTDYSCPCTVPNKIEPVTAVPFKQQGWGVPIVVNIFDLMSPDTDKIDTPYNPIEVDSFAGEGSELYLKIVNQMDDEILVYIESPPAHKGEKITKGQNTFAGWNGPTKTMRGEESTMRGSTDPWVSRITVAPN